MSQFDSGREINESYGPQPAIRDRRQGLINCEKGVTESPLFHLSQSQLSPVYAYETMRLIIYIIIVVSITYREREEIPAPQPRGAVIYLLI